MRYRHLPCCIALLAALPMAPLTAQPAEPCFAVTNVRIFDGEALLPRGTLVAQGALITAVGPDVAVPAGCPTTDGTGRTLLPGLIDGHTHTWGDALTRALIFGVTTELDMFSDPAMARQLRAEQAKDGAPGRADLRSAGFLATAPGGHGTQFGVAVPTLTRPEEAAAWVDRRIAEGSDYIKLVAEDGSPYGMQTPSLDRATLAAVIRAAQARGKLAVGHVSTQESALSLFADGVNGLVHIFTDRAPRPELIAAAQAAKAFVTPTLTVVESTTGLRTGEALADDTNFAPYLRPEELANLRRAFPPRPNLDFGHALAAVRQLHAAGVPILAGSDAPNPGTAHGASMHRELELLVKAGLTPIEALRAATATPAKVFGLADRGRIAPGLRADLLLVKGDPTVRIQATRNILKVWKVGREVPRPLAEVPVEGKLPPAKVPASGLIADFETGQMAATFGAGWMPSTDQLAGGKSVVELTTGPGGAGDRLNDGRLNTALIATGEIREGFGNPWAGAIYFPGDQPMSPANVSRFDGITFRVMGDDGRYTVMLFTASRDQLPLRSAFTAGPAWQEVTVRFKDLGIDGSDLSAIFIGAGAKPGPFRLVIDDLRLIPAP